MQVRPKLFFTILRENGFKIRHDSCVPDDTTGTVNRKVTARWIAAKNTNGHLCTMRGDVHEIGAEKHVSATIVMTKTIRDLSKFETGSREVSSVNADHLFDFIECGKLADGLPLCDDITYDQSRRKKKVDKRTS
jgi:hypothetical protein